MLSAIGYNIFTQNTIANVSSVVLVQFNFQGSQYRIVVASHNDLYVVGLQFLDVTQINYGEIIHNSKTAPTMSEALTIFKWYIQSFYPELG